MAVTATATSKTKDTIISVLRLGKFVQVSENPNKPNISYGVQVLRKQNSLTQYFQWILDELKERRSSTERTIIYCQTVKQCSTLYSLFVQEMGSSIFADDSKDPRKRQVEMLHALSSKENKEVVLKEMGQKDGSIRVLICTIAFGMGVNCKGVQRVIHFGPSKSVEAYIQESGRAGRDGSASKALLLYQSLMLLHVEQEMKDYVKGKYDCRRKFLMSHFDGQDGRPSSNTSSDFVCCDMCSKEANLVVPVAAPTSSAGNTRAVSSAQKKTLKCKLITLRKSLLVELLHQSPKGELPVSTVPELLIGFSDHQISQVLENCDKLFSVSDVKEHVEIWKERHAHAIMDIVSEVFKDVHQEEIQAYHHGDYFDGDDEEDDDWNALFDDAELMDVDWDNFSTSNILFDDSSFLEGSQDFESNAIDAPELADLIDKVQIEPE